MNPTKQKLVDSITERLRNEISAQNPVKFLKELSVEELVDLSISIVYLYTRVTRGSHKKLILLTEMISAIGHGVRNKAQLKKDSALAAKAGGFLLYSFELLDLLKVKLGKGTNNHQAFMIEVLNDEAICNLWATITTTKTEKLPSEIPYAPWTTTKHPLGANLVKTANKDVLTILTPETHPIVFDTINRAQETGWQINTPIYELHLWALRNKTDAFADIWELQNPEAKASKIREAKAIGDIARRFLNKTFYHLYYCDFRGRKYPATAYLHEQGSDLAKGLLLREDKKAIGEQGFFWLLVSIANNWAGDAGRDDGAKTDKIPLNDRGYWALDNEEILLSYAANPKVNQGWMKADKPWQFLAACYELNNLRNYQQAIDDPLDYNYESQIEVFVDGSNNGSQHLSALTKDEVTAPHVNLVALGLPGDLYKYVGDHVWETLEVERDKLTKEQISSCEKVIDTLTDLKKQISTAEQKSERRRELVEKIKLFRKENEELIEKAAPVFWLRICDSKHKRKVVKRNVMTLPYGGSAYGLGQQQIDDAKKHGIESLMTMEHKWASFMGRAVYDDCKNSLKRPMRLLTIFENAGAKAEERGEFLKWNVPVTNFPVVQNYTQGKVKKIYVQYGPPVGERISTGYYENTLQLSICFLEEPVYSKRKQAQGASPNAIHSLDAAHLMLTVYRAPFKVTTIHDSFGCLLADMPELYILIRETFIELYKSNPLQSIMKDIKGDIRSVEIGNLNIEEILDSEYAFA